MDTRLKIIHRATKSHMPNDALVDWIYVQETRFWMTLKWQKHFEDIIAWLKLKKDFSGIERDSNISNVYFVPEGSAHVPFIVLYNDVSSLPDDCEELCCGGYNARTNNLLDFSDTAHNGVEVWCSRLRNSSTHPTLELYIFRFGEIIQIPKRIHRNLIEFSSS